MYLISHKAFIYFLALLCFILFFFILLYQFRVIISSVYFHRKAHEVCKVIAYLEKSKQQPPQHITYSLIYTAGI